MNLDQAGGIITAVVAAILAGIVIWSVAAYL
jgi:hypothetical protein